MNNASREISGMTIGSRNPSAPRKLATSATWWRSKALDVIKGKRCGGHLKDNPQILKWAAVETVMVV
jgi:hypothetical protein